MTNLHIQVCDPLLEEVRSWALDNITILPFDLKTNADIRMEFVKQKHSETPYLSLIQNDGSCVNIDFIHGKKAHRRQFGGGKGQPMVRALGQTDTPPLRVLDLTAGMGNDAFVFANQGFEVVLCERNPFVSKLLEDALARGLEQAEMDVFKTLNRMTLIKQDSTEFVNQYSQKFDAIYMDPMYPEKKKKAATNKEMALLHKIVGPDTDSDQMLAAALKAEPTRVVVKRPKNAPYIAHPTYEPTVSIHSPNTRYDVYVLAALKKHKLG